MYEVTVGNIGKVYATSLQDLETKSSKQRKDEALAQFELYLRCSILNQGRGAQEDVILWENDVPVREHCGAVPRASDVLTVLSPEWRWDDARAVMLPAGASLHWRVIDERWPEYRASGGGKSVKGSDPEQAIARLKVALTRAAKEMADLAGAL